jgi:hypothetical protein
MSVAMGSGTWTWSVVQAVIAIEITVNMEVLLIFPLLSVAFMSVPPK